MKIALEYSAHKLDRARNISFHKRCLVACLGKREKFKIDRLLMPRTILLHDHAAAGADQTGMGVTFLNVDRAGAERIGAVEECFIVKPITILHRLPLGVVKKRQGVFFDEIQQSNGADLLEIGAGPRTYCTPPPGTGV